MPGSNLAKKLAPMVTSEGTQPPRLKLVIRDAAPNDSAPEEKHWLEDNMDILLMILAIAAGIIGYATLGILAVSGR
ncbi:MAG: hypothetical protein ABSD20_04785 [Terriglobales bacterium]|jgi:hypothetical protein